MEIDLDILQRAVLRVLAHARESQGSVIVVPDELYWFINKHEICDPTNDPSDLTLGSSEDDWKQIKSVAQGDREPMGYDLVWISSLLRILGDRIP